MAVITGELIANANYVHTLALAPTSGDYPLQIAVANAINTAAGQGLFTVNVTISSYSNTLVQLLIKLLVDLGYGATTTSTTLTVTW